MNASAPPPNLAEQHAATIARLLVLLDQLLCAIGDRARLPWYARILVPARATRACQAWGEGFRRDIAAMGEKIRDGAYDDDTYWDATYWDDAYWDAEDGNAEDGDAEDGDAGKWDAPEWGDAQGSDGPGEQAFSLGRDRTMIPDRAGAAGLNPGGAVDASYRALPSSFAKAEEPCLPSVPRHDIRGEADGGREDAAFFALADNDLDEPLPAPPYIDRHVDGAAGRMLDWTAEYSPSPDADGRTSARTNRIGATCENGATGGGDADCDSPPGLRRGGDAGWHERRTRPPDGFCFGVRCRWSRDELLRGFSEERRRAISHVYFVTIW